MIVTDTLSLRKPSEGLQLSQLHKVVKRLLIFSAMPKRMSANTLHGICLSFIAKNINHWTSHYEEYHLGQANFLHVLGPFNELSECNII